MRAPDSHDLERFVRAQEGVYADALSELRDGRKRSHWMWFVFPQLEGLGTSAMARAYAIRSADEAKAYLSDPVLGPRLTECCEAALAIEGRSARDIFGTPDDLKLRSCATLFAAVSTDDSVFHRILETFFDGEPDARTLALMSDGLRIVRGGHDDPAVQRLLEHHVTTARAETGRGSAHALDLHGLTSPDVTFWTVWEGSVPVGIGALKRLSPSHGEIKSMHTAATSRRRGVGTALLRHIVESARAMGLTRLSLETGSWAYFEPARAFYRANGFVECGPFGDYVDDPNSVFMTREL
jgi:putative acetyltransferase